ncbi:MAG: hypothetical protein WCP07_11840 [bacterium]
MIVSVGYSRAPRRWEWFLRFLPQGDIVALTYPGPSLTGRIRLTIPAIPPDVSCLRSVPPVSKGSDIAGIAAFGFGDGIGYFPSCLTNARLFAQREGLAPYG